MNENFKYNLLNITRPLKFLPWLIIAFAIFNAIFPTKFGYINYGKVDHNSIKKIEYRAKNVQNGTSKTVVSYGFTYKTKSDELKCVVPMELKDWNWCGDHTCNFNDYTYFKEDGPGKKKAIIEKIKTDGHYVKKPAVLCNFALCLWAGLIFLIQIILIGIFEPKDEIASLYFHFPCEEYNYTESIKLRFTLNMLFLGFSKTDINKFLDHVYAITKKSYSFDRDIYKSNCKYKEFTDWLKTQNNN